MLRFAVLLLGACAAASAGELVAPNNQATTPGNFAVQVGAAPSRFQQIVGSGQFTVPIMITGMRVRAAAGSGPVSFNHSSDKITLSTTPVYPNTNNGHTPCPAPPSPTTSDLTPPLSTTVPLPLPLLAAPALLRALSTWGLLSRPRSRTTPTKAGSS